MCNEAEVNGKIPEVCGYLEKGPPGRPSPGGGTGAQDAKTETRTQFVEEDPLGRAVFGGAERELLAVHTYKRGVAELRTNLRSAPRGPPNTGTGGTEEDAEVNGTGGQQNGNGAPRKGNPGGRQRPRKREGDE